MKGYNYLLLNVIFHLIFKAKIFVQEKPVIEEWLCSVKEKDFSWLRSYLGFIFTLVADFGKLT